MQFARLLREHHVLAPFCGLIVFTFVVFYAECLVLRKRHFLYEKPLEVRHLSGKLCEIYAGINLISKNYRLLFANACLIGRDGYEKIFCRYAPVGRRCYGLVLLLGVCGVWCVVCGTACVYCYGVCLVGFAVNLESCGRYAHCSCLINGAGVCKGNGTCPRTFSVYYLVA